MTNLLAIIQNGNGNIKLEINDEGYGSNADFGLRQSAEEPRKSRGFKL
ncbi:hypothetical protein ACIXMS_14785 [Bacteroides fragilis]|nr:hypothetical protein [Bacteroides fragilis]